MEPIERLAFAVERIATCYEAHQAIENEMHEQHLRQTQAWEDERRARAVVDEVAPPAPDPLGQMGEMMMRFLKKAMGEDE